VSRRRKRRGGEVWGACPSPHRVWGGGCAPPQKIFLHFLIEMAHFVGIAGVVVRARGVHGNGKDWDPMVPWDSHGNGNKTHGNGN